jgi:hypothetical protein
MFGPTWYWIPKQQKTGVRHSFRIRFVSPDTLLFCSKLFVTWQKNTATNRGQIFKHWNFHCKNTKLAHNLEVRTLSKFTVITNNQKCPFLASVVNKTYYNNKGKGFPCIRIEKQMAPLSSLQEPPCDVRCGNKAAANISSHVTALSGHDRIRGGKHVRFTACFPNLGVP